MIATLTGCELAVFGFIPCSRPSGLFLSSYHAGTCTDGTVVSCAFISRVSLADANSQAEQELEHLIEARCGE